jgi:phage tail tape-measure protein
MSENTIHAVNGGGLPIIVIDEHNEQLAELGNAWNTDQAYRQAIRQGYSVAHTYEHERTIYVMARSLEMDLQRLQRVLGMAEMVVLFESWQAPRLDAVTAQMERNALLNELDRRHTEAGEAMEHLEKHFGLSAAPPFEKL